MRTSAYFVVLLVWSALAMTNAALWNRPFSFRKPSIHPSLGKVIEIRGGIQIFVKTLLGKTIPVDVEPGALVESIKDKIQETEVIPPNEQHFIFGGKRLDTLRSFADYDIVDGSTLHLVLRIISGKLWHTFKK